MTWKPPALFSQNFEDLYLWRIFKEQEQGFYVDVGAYHPETHSVTKIFYDQGWEGINIEPVPGLFKYFQEQRPRDVNLPIAISTESRLITLNTYGESGLSSVKSSSWVSAPLEIKDSHHSIEVESRRLYDVLMAYAPVSIDFLKVDVEGLEADVLQSACPELLPVSMKPKLVLVEATMPMTRVPGASRDRCKAILVNWGYRHFFFDGLNDYYCLEHDFVRCSCITLPPNVFDGIPLTPEIFQSMRSVEISLRQEIGELKHRCSALELETVEYQQRELLAASEALQLREKAKEPDHRLSEYNLLMEQWNDLRDEVFRLHLENTKLACQVERQEGKLAWLRSQRLNLLKLLHKANKTIRRLSSLASKGNFGLLPDRK